MTSQEIDHQNYKDQLRQEAVDKEVQRLRIVTRKQSVKIVNLKKALYFTLLFFATLFLVLILRGMISVSGESKVEREELEQKFVILAKEHNAISDSLKWYRQELGELIDDNLYKRKEAGLKFRVQIGAFKEIDLRNYAENFAAIRQEVYDSINQYTLGEFVDLNKAKEFLSVIRKMGFDDSFIIATRDGRRIPLEKLPKSDLEKYQD
jgi:hypothetical protein